MAEIKHTFTGGKMNKDVDERLVPNGEFRDAENVQVRTSSGDAIGTVQNIKGTALLGSSYFDSNWMSTTNTNTLPRCVAGIADEKSDKAYFFYASPPLDTFMDLENGTVTPNLANTQHVFIDSIIEQSVDGTTTPVAVDKHTVVSRFNDVFAETADPSVPGFYDQGNFPQGWTSFQVIDTSHYRVDMTIKALALNNNDQLVDLFAMYITEGGTVTNVDGGNEAKIKAIDYENNIITLYEEQFTNLSGVQYFVFQAQPALGFQGNQITGVNIVDNLLFWTDNHTEPKKLNIDRGKKGTSDIQTHTKLFVKHATLSDGPGSPTYVEVNQVSPGLEDYPTNTDLREEHLTVLRRAPRTAPTLEMSNTLRSSATSVDFDYQFYDGVLPPVEGSNIIIGPVTEFGQTSFNIGDIITIGQTDDPLENPGAIVGTFINYVDDLGGGDYSPSLEPTSYVEIKMTTVVQPIPALEREWRMSTKEVKPIFELKFARFGYRYKYTDGEYSAFSPWSELAFMPGEFDLVIRKAYNLGMVNELRELFIKDFIPYKTPLDVAEVDILYKSANEPNVHTVKTIKKTKDDEWENNTPSFVNPDEIRTGRIKLTTELLHKVIDSNQILRSWDNVPRKALAQEITGNRLVYGNYTQGYDFKYPVGLRQQIVSEDTARLEDPQKSVKSIRQYKWGMVFGDKYGRETPVIESSLLSTAETSSTGDVVNDKENAKFRNYFELKQSWDSVSLPNGEPPEWADYVKYYVKEPTNEYYNMVLDRWYWADYEKDNVWLSFNSSDRNKVDEETYLILKNQHGNHNPVNEPAKYKIIAIEDEAPEYIRTLNRPIGTVGINPRNTTSQNFATAASSGGWALTSTVWDVGITLDTTIIPSPEPVFLMTQT